MQKIILTLLVFAETSVETTSNMNGHRRNISGVSTYECPTSPNPSTSGLHLNPLHAVPASHAKCNESFEPDKSDSDQENETEEILPECYEERDDETAKN